jgi:hypothetical protein
MPMLGRYTTSAAKIIEVKTAPALPEGVKPLTAVDVENSVITNAGARPWERDEPDWRVIADTIEGRGKIIDSEQEVGGYPVQLAAHQEFNPSDWDMRAPILVTVAGALLALAPVVSPMVLRRHLWS